MARASMNRTRAYWTCQITGWSLYAIGSFVALGLNIERGFSWPGMINHVVTAGLGLGVTHAFRSFAHRTGWTELSLRRLVPRVLGAAVILSIVYVALGDLLAVLGLVDIVAQDMDAYWSLPRVVLSVFGSAMILGLWLVIYFGVHYFWNFRAAEVDAWKLEAQATSARLKALKLQLNPHFFFNSLNSVRALIANDPERAQQMITRLARLLRSTLQVDDVKTVPLEDELATARTYLELEKVRFEDRLTYHFDVRPPALERRVPFLLVQTLVENSIKHGIAQRQDGGTVTVKARIVSFNDGTLTEIPAPPESKSRAGEGNKVVLDADSSGDTASRTVKRPNGVTESPETMLCIDVTNPGQLNPNGDGTGLRNARERLLLLFGEASSLTIREDNGVVVARALLPNRQTPHASKATAGESHSAPEHVASRIPERDISDQTRLR